MELNPWIPFITTAIAIFLILRRFTERATSDEKPTQWPPGPRKLPILGNLHQLSGGGTLVHHTLAKLAQAHGRIMTIWIGGWQPTIVVSDAELAWEVLVNKSPDYAARALPAITNHHTADGRTVAGSDVGSHWHTLRRGLQNGPLGPFNLAAQAHSQEGDVSIMIRSMEEEAQKKCGVVNPFLHIRRNTIRLLARLCFGREFGDESFVEAIDRAVEDTIKVTGHGRLVDAFAFARLIPSVRRTFEETLEVKCRIEVIIRPYLTQTPPPNSYLHVLLSQNMPEQVTIFSIFELFLLGVDSTAATTAWALAFMIHHQDVQEKLFQEISDYSAGDASQTVRVEDVGKLHYLQAVTKETMRMKPIAPLAVPHKTSKETKLNGRKVAKGTQVLVNIYSVHYDEKAWVEPHRFLPERFTRAPAGEKTASTAADQSFLPFGGGMRACAGMEVGKAQVAMVLANLVKKFKWSPAVEGKLPDMTEELTFVLMMKTPLTAKIHLRGI